MNKAMFLAATAFCLFWQPSFADGWATSNGSAHITTIDVESGVVRVWYSATDDGNPDACANTGVFILADDTKNGDRQYAALLAAHAANKAISLWVSGCWAGWGSTWPKLASLFVTAN